jgi:hypothetical protein
VRTPIAVAVILIAFTVTGCGPTTPSATPSPSATVVETPLVTPSPVVTVEPEPASLSDDDYQNIAESISSGNTAALEGYLADSVSVTLAASECCGDLSPTDTISTLNYVSSATGPWTFPVSDATLASYRAGFYSDSFPEGVFVGMSSDSDPYVVAFAIEGNKITAILIAGDAVLLS